jgi:hypothetical protein
LGLLWRDFFSSSFLHFRTPRQLRFHAVSCINTGVGTLVSYQRPIGVEIATGAAPELTGVFSTVASTLTMVANGCKRRDLHESKLHPALIQGT